MNQPFLKEVQLTEISLIEVLQLNKKEDMLAIAEINEAQVKKSQTKAKIAADLAEQLIENSSEQLGYFRSNTMATIETILAQSNEPIIQLTVDQVSELTNLEKSGYLYTTNKKDDQLSISLALELKKQLNEMQADKTKMGTIKMKQKLVDYSLALTHLYGAYDIDQLVKVWNKYQTNSMSDEEMTAEIQKIVEKQVTIKWDGTLIFDPSFLNGEEAYSFYDALASRKVPYYMPTENEVDLYAEFSVNQQSPHYLNMHNYIHSKSYEQHIEDQIMSEISASVILGVQPDKIYESLAKIGLTFMVEEDVITFVQLLQELSNQTRKWSYRGWTPAEIEALQEKETPKKTPVTVNKIGRNEPCPCGSGKKYKKCHG